MPFIVDGAGVTVVLEQDDGLLSVRWKKVKGANDKDAEFHFDIYVWYETPDEQEEIVSFVKKRIEIINDNITKAYREIELIKEYRSSLITEVVTGKRKII